MRDSKTMNEKKTWLGIGSWTYPYHCGLGESISSALKFEPVMTAQDLISKAYENQISCVQIADNLPLEKLSSEAVRDIGSFAAERNISIETGLRGATASNISRMLNISSMLNSKLLRCVIDNGDYKPEVEEVITLFRSFLPELRERGIVLGIENHDRLLSEEFASIMSALDDPCYGIVLDTTNSLSKEEPLQTVIDNLACYTVCLHLKDYTIRRIQGSVGLEIVGTPLGQGRQNVKKILNAVKTQAQQDFSTIIEFWMPAYGSIDYLLLEEDRWVEESIDYIKGLI